ncbi:MAG: TolC family protein [Deltaproteobacteria bacterium]|nr:TolC family protein [Deltaproteobacteria bacterium]
MSSILVFSLLFFPICASENAEVLTYEQALIEAKSKNLNLKAAQAKLEQANEISRKAWAAYLPTITASAAYTINKEEQFTTMPTGYWIRTLPTGATNPNGPNNDADIPGTPSNDILFPNGAATTVLQPKKQLVGQIALTQALIVPPLLAAIKSSYASEKVAKLNVNNMQQEVLFSVAQLYYNAVGLKQALAAQQRLLVATLAHEKDAATRVKAGTMPRIALIRAEIDRARAEQDVQRAENALVSAKIALATMIQRQGNFEVVEPNDPEVKIETNNLEKSALENRLDVLAAKAGENLASIAQKSAWLQYLPSIIGSASYQYANFGGTIFDTNPNADDSTKSWAITISASWTLWDGGLRECTMRESEAYLVESRATARAAEQQAIDDVRRSLLDLESARANTKKASEQLTLARENMHLVEVNYKSGVATQLDVTDATTQLTTAELGAIGERLNAQLATLRLLKAAGLFQP